MTSRVVLLGAAPGGTYKFGDGSAAAPSIAFASDPDTGMYWVSANRLGFATNGTLRVDIGNTGITLASGLSIDMSSGTTAITLGGGGSITGASGALTLAASGTNQNITLTPSGTGAVVISGSSATLTLSDVSFVRINGNAVRFGPTGSIAHIYGSPSAAYFGNNSGGGGAGMTASNGGALTFSTGAGVTAFTADTSQRLILSGALRLNNAHAAGAPTATGYVTVQDSAGNTMKLLCSNV